jgi:hypothetical protein
VTFKKGSFRSVPQFRQNIMCIFQISPGGKSSIHPSVASSLYRMSKKGNSVVSHKRNEAYFAMSWFNLVDGKFLALEIELFES